MSASTDACLSSDRTLTAVPSSSQYQHTTLYHNTSMSTHQHQHPAPPPRIPVTLDLPHSMNEHTDSHADTINTPHPTDLSRDESTGGEVDPLDSLLRSALLERDAQLRALEEEFRLDSTSTDLHHAFDPGFTWTQLQEMKDAMDERAEGEEGAGDGEHERNGHHDEEYDEYDLPHAASALYQNQHPTTLDTPQSARRDNTMNGATSSSFRTPFSPLRSPAYPSSASASMRSGMRSSPHHRSGQQHQHLHQPGSNGTNSSNGSGRSMQSILTSPSLAPTAPSSVAESISYSFTTSSQASSPTTPWSAQSKAKMKEMEERQQQQKQFAKMGNMMTMGGMNGHSHTSSAEAASGTIPASSTTTTVIALTPSTSSPLIVKRFSNHPSAHASPVRPRASMANGNGGVLSPASSSTDVSPTRLSSFRPGASNSSVSASAINALLTSSLLFSSPSAASAAAEISRLTSEVELGRAQHRVLESRIIALTELFVRQNDELGLDESMSLEKAQRMMEREEAEEQEREEMEKANVHRHRMQLHQHTHQHQHQSSNDSLDSSLISYSSPPIKRVRAHSDPHRSRSMSPRQDGDQELLIADLEQHAATGSPIIKPGITTVSSLTVPQSQQRTPTSAQSNISSSSTSIIDPLLFSQTLSRLVASEASLDEANRLLEELREGLEEKEVVLERMRTEYESELVKEREQQQSQHTAVLSQLTSEHALLKAQYEHDLQERELDLEARKHEANETKKEYEISIEKMKAVYEKMVEEKRHEIQKIELHAKEADSELSVLKQQLSNTSTELRVKEASLELLKEQHTKTQADLTKAIEATVHLTAAQQAHSSSSSQAASDVTSALLTQHQLALDSKQAGILKLTSQVASLEAQLHSTQAARDHAKHEVAETEEKLLARVKLVEDEKRAIENELAGIKREYELKLEHAHQTSLKQEQEHAAIVTALREELAVLRAQYTNLLQQHTDVVSSHSSQLHDLQTRSALIELAHSTALDQARSVAHEEGVKERQKQEDEHRVRMEQLEEEHQQAKRKYEADLQAREEELAALQQARRDAADNHSSSSAVSESDHVAALNILRHEYELKLAETLSSVQTLSETVSTSDSHVTLMKAKLLETKAQLKEKERELEGAKEKQVRMERELRMAMEETKQEQAQSSSSSLSSSSAPHTSHDASSSIILQHQRVLSLAQSEIVSLTTQITTLRGQLKTARSAMDEEVRKERDAEFHLRCKELECKNLTRQMAELREDLASPASVRAMIGGDGVLATAESMMTRHSNDNYWRATDVLFALGGVVLAVFAVGQATRTFGLVGESMY